MAPIRMLLHPIMAVGTNGAAPPHPPPEPRGVRPVQTVRNLVWIPEASVQQNLRPVGERDVHVGAAHVDLKDGVVLGRGGSIQC